MGVKEKLLDFLVHLPAVDSPAERKALLTFTGSSEVGIYLDWQGSSVEFAERLLEQLSRRGKAALAGFLAGLPNTPQVANSVERQQQLAALRAQVDSLDAASFQAEFPVPRADTTRMPGLAADPAMLASTVVNEVLAPYYKLGAQALQREAGGRAVTLAERTAGRIEAALSGDRVDRAVFDIFKESPGSKQVQLLGVLRARLEHSPSLTRELLDLFTSAAAEPERAGLQALVDVSRRIGVVKGDVVGAIVGADALGTIWGLRVQDVIDTVEPGGRAIGAVLGDARPRSTGGQHHHGDNIDTGGGAVFGGQVEAGRDVFGGDRIEVAPGAKLVINRGPEPNPETPLIEEAIRLDVAAPPAATLEVPFDLAVAVRKPGAPPLAAEDLTEVKSEEGSIFRHEEDEVVLYRIAVSATGCDVEPSHYVLKLRPYTDSRPCWFQITAHRSGRVSVFVSAYQEDDALAAQTRLSVKIEVPVAPDG